LARPDARAGDWYPTPRDFLRTRLSSGLAQCVLYPSLSVTQRRERIQTVETISINPQVPSDPVSLGDICQAMFIEGARVLGYTGEAPMPKEVQEQVFLAVTLMADGLGVLLEAENDEDEQDLAG
jgi:hypothetical protein